MYSVNRPQFLIIVCIIIFGFLIITSTYFLNTIKSEISTFVFAPGEIRVSVIPQTEVIRKLKSESELKLDERDITSSRNLELRQKHHVPDYMLDLFNQWNYTREAKNKNQIVRPPVDVVKSVIPIQIVPLRHKGTILSSMSLDADGDDCYRLIFEIPQNKWKGEIFVDGEFRVMSQIGNARSGIERLLKIRVIEKSLKYPILIKSKHIFHKENTWESFNVTDSIRQILQRKITTRMERILSIEICVERIWEKYFKDTNYYFHQKDKHFQLSLLPDSGSSYLEHKHPLLLLSYILKQKKTSEEGVSKKQDESITKASIGAPLNHITFFKLSNKLENVIPKENTEKYNSYKDLRNNENFEIVRKRAKFQNHRNKRSRRDAEISENDDDNNNVWDDGNKSFAEERTRERREKRFSNSCKRKPLYVDFAEINYDSWIVQPSGYEAYQCSGKCLYPVASHLTPTKHAVIQALVHSVNPVKAHRTCCVPTKLGSISILYIDYKGVLTYRFAYQNMVVRECGCR